MRDRVSEIFEMQAVKQILRAKALRISPAGSDARNTAQFAGEFTTRVTPVPIPNTEVKPRWADGTARVTVWEIR